MRSSMVFYKSFLVSIRLLPKKQQLQFYNALFDYGFDGVPPEGLSGGAAALFNALKPQIDANNRKFENGCKGGRPPKNQNETNPKPNDNQNETNPKPNEDEDEASNEDGAFNGPGSQANAGDPSPRIEYDFFAGIE